MPGQDDSRSTSRLPGLKESDFRELAKIVRATIGIHLPSSKRDLVASRLLPRLRELGLSAFASYRERVQEDAEERSRFLERMCTHETRFFREPEQFRCLAEHVYPEWLRAVQLGQRARSVRVWSAACSTGQEPFSFAMHLHHHLAGHGFGVDVLATDLSTRVLAVAQHGIWRDAEIENVPPDLLRHYMLRGTRSQAGKVAAGAEIRNLVRFARLNLNDLTYGLPSFDLVVCRNVLMYFDAPTRLRVRDQLLRHVAPGGHLILGHAESVLGHHEELRPLGCCIFRKERRPGPSLSPGAGAELAGRG